MQPEDTLRGDPGTYFQRPVCLGSVPGRPALASRPGDRPLGGPGVTITASSFIAGGVQPAMRFLCDEMLRGLGKWLRAAGYDTVVAEGGLPDPLVAARCAAEHRILLTRDRHLAAAAGAVTRVVLLRQGSIDADASALHNTLGVNWHYAPFTRCLIDNCPLEPAPPQLAGQVPAQSQAVGGPLRICPDCRRIYWPGGHVRRMQQRLAKWQNARGGPRRDGLPVGSSVTA